MKKKCIIVNGYPRSGKDLFVDSCIFQLYHRGYQGVKLSSVDKVKEAATILGWDGHKNDKGRKFLSDLKDLSIEAYDGPLHYLLDHIANTPAHYFFLMIREPSEIKKFKDAYPNTITVCVIRETAEKHHQNTGDSAIENYMYNVNILNNGDFMDLQKIVDTFLEALCR